MLVDFVIITALKEEQEALLAKLPPVQRLPPSDDDVHVYYRTELPVTLSDGTTGTYTLILLSIMGMTREKAAIFTGDALHRWHPRYVLLVGIAGGIASAQVARGDVLISEQIVDYEHQKITAQGEREHRWEVHRGDPRLLEASRYLGDSWRRLIRKKRPQPGKPATFFGPIATGDKVVDYLPFLGDLLRHWPKLIGVEMESGGVANAAFQAAKVAGFFMIRGVSDLAENKDDTWRQYACHAAAAYTLALLQSGPVPLNAPLRKEGDRPLAVEPVLPPNETPILHRPYDKAIGEELPSPPVSEAEDEQLVPAHSAVIEHNQSEVISTSPNEIPPNPPIRLKKVSRRRLLVGAGLAILVGAYPCYRWIYPPPSSPVSSPFNVYTDANARGNHYTPTGFMGDYDAIKLTEKWRENPHSGRSCIRVDYSGIPTQNNNWAGVYWQDPPNNWGWAPRQTGYNLSKLSQLSFWVRGDTGNEQIQFFVGGISGLYGGFPDGDSLQPAVYAQSGDTNWITCTTSWQQITIDLKGQDLTHIVGGFGWSTNNDSTPLTFYLDDIIFT